MPEAFSFKLKLQFSKKKLFMFYSGGKENAATQPVKLTTTDHQITISPMSHILQEMLP